MMEDCIVIENEWTQGEIKVEDDFNFEIKVESGFDILVEPEFDDESEIHLVMGEIVEKSKAEETEYDALRRPVKTTYLGTNGAPKRFIIKCHRITSLPSYRESETNMSMTIDKRCIICYTFQGNMFFRAPCPVTAFLDI